MSLGDAPPYVKALPAPIRRQLYAACDGDWARVVVEDGSVVVKNTAPPPPAPAPPARSGNPMAYSHIPGRAKLAPAAGPGIDNTHGFIRTELPPAMPNKSRTGFKKAKKAR